MPRHPTPTRNSTALLRTFLLVCLTLGLAVPAAAQLTNKTYNLDVPDTDTLKKLKDGEHVIAAVETDRGKLEVRVRVKGKAVSDHRFLFP